MKAILLIGGKGTRLYPLTLKKPKALLPVLKRPFLSYQLDLLKEGKVSDVMLACGKHNRPWRRAFEKLAPRGIKMHFAFEPKPLGTGGAIRFAYDRLKKITGADRSPVLVFNGDVFFDLSVDRFLEAHVRNRALGTIAMTRVDDPSRFGLVDTDKHGRIKRFIEKSPEPFTDTINAGAYLLEPSVISSIPAGRACSVERDVFPKLLRQRKPLYGFLMKGYWNDIGTHESYLQAQTELLSIKNRWTQQLLLRKRAALK